MQEYGEGDGISRQDQRIKSSPAGVAIVIYVRDDINFWRTIILLATVHDVEATLFVAPSQHLSHLDILVVYRTLLRPVDIPT